MPWCSFYKSLDAKKDQIWCQILPKKNKFLSLFQTLVECLFPDLEGFLFSFLGIKPSTSILVQKKHFLLNLTPNLFLVLHFFQLYSAKNAENEDFDSVLGAQHPNACGNIQHQCQVPVSTTPIFVGWNVIAPPFPKV